MPGLHVRTSADFTITRHETQQPRVSDGLFDLFQRFILRPCTQAVESICPQKTDRGLSPTIFITKFIGQRFLCARGANGLHRGDTDVEHLAALRIDQPPSVINFGGMKKTRGFLLLSQHSTIFAQT